MRAACGQPPSVLLRTVRLHRLAALARTSGTWADAAARAGYADQSHLCHETRALAGRTPSQLLGDG